MCGWKWHTHMNACDIHVWRHVTYTYDCEHDNPFNVDVSYTCHCERDILVWLRSDIHEWLLHTRVTVPWHTRVTVNATHVLRCASRWTCHINYKASLNCLCTNSLRISYTFISPTKQPWGSLYTNSLRVVYTFISATRQSWILCAPIRLV